MRIFITVVVPLLLLLSTVRSSNVAETANNDNHSVYTSGGSIDEQSTREHKHSSSSSSSNSIEKGEAIIGEDMLQKMQKFVVDNVCTRANGIFKHIAAHICGPSNKNGGNDNDGGEGGELIGNKDWSMMDGEKWESLKQAIQQDLNELFAEGNGFVAKQLETSDKAIHDWLQTCSRTQREYCEVAKKFMDAEVQLDSVVEGAQKKLGHFNTLKGEYANWLKEMATNAKSQSVLMPSKMFTSCKDLWGIVKKRMKNSSNRRRKRQQQQQEQEYQRRVQDPGQLIVIVTLVLVVFMAMMKDGMGMFSKVFGLLSASFPLIVGMYGYLFVSSLFNRGQ